MGAYCENNVGLYYNADEYTYIAFKNTDDILGNYNGLNLIVALHVNNASLYKNPLTGEDVGYSAGHFKLYITEFIKGINIATPLTYTDRLLYLVDSAPSNLYYASDWALHDRYSERCVNIDGQNYVRIKVSDEKSDGSVTNANLNWEFGEYYDALMDVMVTGEYSVTDDRGDITHYGLIRLADLAAVIYE